MKEENDNNIDVKQIMAKIKEEVAKNGPYEEILPFESIPIEVEQEEKAISVSEVKGLIKSKTSNLEIPPVYGIENANPIKRIYKKIVSKIVRCATFPITVRATETNNQLKESLELTLQIVEQQQMQIEKLKKDIEEMKANG